jgi:uncharacterized protein YjbJ (UPF0337 family)
MARFLLVLSHTALSALLTNRWAFTLTNNQELKMNLDQLKGNWKKLKGDLKSEFGKLTDDEIMQAEGEATVLVGKIQEKYGVTKEQAKEKLDEFLERH